MKNFLPLIISVFVFASCSNPPAVKVTRIGELEDLIKKGDMQTHAKLQDYANEQHLYAFGSLTNLRGFTQIIDSKPYTATVENGQLKIDSSFNSEETLFLYATVDDWKELDLPADVKTWKQLEQFIGDQAIKYKVPKKYPSPFLLKGIVADVKWRVIDWDPNDKEVTYKKTVQSGIHGELQNEYITAIGFYSVEPYQVLAHKETKMHIHVVNHDHSIAGHVDDLGFDGGMKLYLPKKYVEGK
ncbi:MAG TPA: acetolactate decarboxylase [Chitinophagales bacterium]|nr:acetolactate decarboxylase [Chitinophagales bacterium]